MKIAIISRFDFEVSPLVQSGISVFLYTFINALAEYGTCEQIDVYGVGKNYFHHPKIHFINVLEENMNSFLMKEDIAQKLKNYPAKVLFEHGLFDLFAKTFTLLKDNNYDIIYDNSTSPLFYIMADLLPCPVVTTIHTSPFAEVIYLPYKLGCIQSKNHSFVAISNCQKNLLFTNNIHLHVVQTILHGIDVTSWTYSQHTKASDPALWIGRIQQADDKGADVAIEVIRFLNLHLYLVGKITDTQFFNQKLAHKIDGHITHINSTLSFEEKNQYYQNASFLLYPLLWEEPFGLVFLESLASGTPVIAYARGAVPEIIKDGQTGFIVNPSDDDIRGNWIIKKTGIEGLKEAIKRIHTMSEKEYAAMRKMCRTHIEQNFTAQNMIKQYEAVFQNMVQKRKP